MDVCCLCCSNPIKVKGLHIKCENCALENTKKLLQMKNAFPSFIGKIPCRISHGAKQERSREGGACGIGGERKTEVLRKSNKRGNKTDELMTYVKEFKLRKRKKCELQYYIIKQSYVEKEEQYVYRGVNKIHKQGRTVVK